MDLHLIKLENGILTLDGKEIEGLISYEIQKSSATEPPELSLKLIVKERQ